MFKQLRHLLKYKSTNVFININYENPNFDRINNIITDRYPNIYLIKASNKGKDIGGKLALIQLYMKLNISSDYLLFLHDKKSPQLANGNSWQYKLFDIAKEDNIAKVLILFADKNVGMIGSRDNIMSKRKDPESKIFVNNKDIVLKMASKYNLKSTDYSFVGGTMFWVRESAFMSFFRKYSPLEIRSNLEMGNVMDDFGPTVTHSWERLLGWIVTSSGLTIKGI
jgi:lipopolysaccharide biosynthesis protein